MSTQTIETTLYTSGHPDIAKRTSVSGLIITAAMLLIGILLFTSIVEVNDKSSAISMGLMVLGTILVLLAVFRLFWKTKEMVYLPTGSVARQQSFFFDLKHMEKLKEMIEQGKPECDSQVKSEASGNVRMDVMLSKDNKFAAIQLFQFVPYTYMPVTSVRYFTGTEAATVSSFLLKCRKA